MAHRPKTGRRANTKDRECAAEWVRLYRLAEQSPDHRHCVNPEAPPEEQVFIDADDPELLLLALSGFAEHGTFQNIDPLNFRRMVIRAELEQIRQKGVRHDDRIADIAESRRASTRSIQRWKKVNDKP